MGPETAMALSQTQPLGNAGGSLSMWTYTLSLMGWRFLSSSPNDMPVSSLTRARTAAEWELTLVQS